MSTAVQQQTKDAATLNDVDLLTVGAEDFDVIRDLRLYIELPNDTIVELHEATTRPGVWKATVTIGGEAHHTVVHCLHGKLREAWAARNRARNREALRRSREGAPRQPAA
jgi:hypothetical protein